MKTVYLIIALLCTILVYSQVIPFVAENGLDLRLMAEQMFANRIAAALSMDLILSALVVILLFSTEGRRQKVPHLWLPIVTTILIGVSCGLPLYLYQRERTRNTV